MATYSTPGSYIEEISKLPASVAPVATAIPAFIGYTEKDGEANEYHNVPVRITSMLDYEEKFGGAYNEEFEITLADNATTGDTDISVAPAAGKAMSPYILNYQLNMYFANGGGPCYIVSVGVYDYTNPGIDKDDLLDGLSTCKTEDEITVLCVPEAIVLDTVGRTSINNDMLDQCALLKDRFAVMDVWTGDDTVSVKVDGDDFRNEVGMDALKYGAAYYPALRTSLEYGYDESKVLINDTRTFPIYTPGTIKQPLSSIFTGMSATATALGIKAIHLIKINSISNGDQITIGGVTYDAVDPGSGPGPNSYFVIDSDNNITASNLKNEISGLNGFSINVSTNTITITADSPGTSGENLLIEYTTVSGDIDVSLSEGVNGANLALYHKIKKVLSTQKLTLHPCAAIAGIYARVDRNRGVWKAPANVSLNRVIVPSKLITQGDQDTLNIDDTTGKSINAIRQFSGKGNLVWGARTLAGNDAEWRYVSTRRFFNFMEESIQKATEFVVFEPNDANTWNRVKGMIENFLTLLWREGALAGAKPEDAFFVNIGLGVTMTSDDILNGKMNVEIGVAVVRPAEFIILKFSHKLQES